MPPFLFTYQLDLALHPIRLGGLQLGGKANRIAEEANRIRLARKHHWFGCEYLPWAPWKVEGVDGDGVMLWENGKDPMGDQNWGGTSDPKEQIGCSASGSAFSLFLPGIAFSSMVV